MATTPKHTVEVYDNLTGEHYTRDCTPEELEFYKSLENPVQKATTDE
jgi:hypothetical protein